MSINSKYKLAKEIGEEYDRIREEQLREILELTPQERYRVFEETCNMVYEIYKAGRKYVKRNGPKGTRHA